MTNQNMWASSIKENGKSWLFPVWTVTTGLCWLPTVNRKARSVLCLRLRCPGDTLHLEVHLSREAVSKPQDSLPDTVKVKKPNSVLLVNQAASFLKVTRSKPAIFQLIHQPVDMLDFYTEAVGKPRSAGLLMGWLQCLTLFGPIHVLYWPLKIMCSLTKSQDWAIDNYFLVMPS